MNSIHIDELTSTIISAAIEVHRTLGPGLLESAYERCLCRELELRVIPFVKQKPIPVEYKGVSLECGYRIDICVADCVVVEVKAVGELLKIHDAQLLTYLRLTGMSVGLLLNFNVPLMKDGIRRIVHNHRENSL